MSYFWLAYFCSGVYIEKMIKWDTSSKLAQAGRKNYKKKSKSLKDTV